MLKLSSKGFWFAVFKLFVVGQFFVVTLWAAIKVAILFRILTSIEATIANFCIIITNIAVVFIITVERWPLPWFDPVRELITLVTFNCQTLHLNQKF